MAVCSANSSSSTQQMAYRCTVQTPYEMLTGKKPNVSRMQRSLFGLYATLTNRKKENLSPDVNRDVLWDTTKTAQCI